MAQYRAGTVSVTTNSQTVTGSGTNWLSAGIEAGHWFSVRDEGMTYTVAAVISDTQLVLNGAYQGSTRSGLFYLIHVDFTPRGFAVPGPGDVDASLIVRRSIFEIDADLTAALGDPDTGNRAIQLSDIVDLKSTTALTGQVMTKLPDGTFGFASPGALTVSVANLGSAGTNAGFVYAGSDGTNFNLRQIRVVGGTLTQNANDLTITIPPAGEANTAVSIGTSSAVSVVGAKSGTALSFRGIRGTNGVTATLDGTDIVLVGPGAGGGTTVGEANTGANLGTAGSGVAMWYSDKSGTALRFKSILFTQTDFTLLEGAGQYILSARKQRLADAPDVSLTGGTTGQVLTLQADGILRLGTPPATGLRSVQEDPAPRLSANLTLAGNRVLGIANTLSGHLEKPKQKSYTLVLRTNNPIVISSMTAETSAGTVGFRVFIGREIIDIPGSSTPVPISGTATAAGTEVAPTETFSVPPGSRLTMALTPDVAAEDFVFSLAYQSA